MNLRDVKKVTVCGAGTMGPTVAQIFASYEYDVMLYDFNNNALQRSKSIIRTQH